MLVMHVPSHDFHLIPFAWTARHISNYVALLCRITQCSMRAGRPQDPHGIVYSVSSQLFPPSPSWVSWRAELSTSCLMSWSRLLLHCACCVLHRAVVLTPILLYGIFNVYRDKVNPRIKYSDFLFICAGVAVVANLVGAAWHAMLQTSERSQFTSTCMPPLLGFSLWFAAQDQTAAVPPNMMQTLENQPQAAQPL